MALEFFQYFWLKGRQERDHVLSIFTPFPDLTIRIRLPFRLSIEKDPSPGMMEVVSGGGFLLGASVPRFP
jgi:hypothetical protein